MDTIDRLLAQEFSLDPDIIYLNHAAVAPWPTRTMEAVLAFAEENRRQGAKNYPRWVEVESRVRDQAAQLMRAASADDIALLKNTSEALSVVAYGLSWARGDNVVISNEEFPSNRIVWESLKPLGVEIREVAIRGVADPEQALLAACDEGTRLLSVSSVQYASGFRLNLERLGRELRQRDIAFCVDAIQSLGALRHDVQAEYIDFLMADAHKWLLGPEAVALFYVRDAWRERLSLHQYGWHMVQDHMNFDRREWQPAKSGRRFECGSPNMLGIHALSASLSLFAQVGMEQVEKRVLARAEALFHLFAEASGFELVTDSGARRFGGIVTFRSSRKKPQAIYDHLRARNVVCAQRGGGVRLSPHFHTPMGQLHKVVDFLKTL